MPFTPPSRKNKPPRAPAPASCCPTHPQDTEREQENQALLVPAFLHGGIVLILITKCLIQTQEEAQMLKNKLKCCCISMFCIIHGLVLGRSRCQGSNTDFCGHRRVPEPGSPAEPQEPGTAPEIWDGMAPETWDGMAPETWKGMALGVSQDRLHRARSSLG